MMRSHEPERLGHDEERAGGDPVCPLFIFLHLLRGDPDGVAKLLLAEAEHGATQPDATSNLAVDMPPLNRRLC